MALSEAAIREAKKNMELVKKGKIRNHKLKNTAVVHSGELEEKEAGLFHDFLNTRNCTLILGLKGEDHSHTI